MQKRLLILGGQQKLCDIVLKAKQMGIYTVVTDWYEDSPAKKIADKAYMISTSDVDGILQLIRDEKIDGVITGYIDSTLPYYYEICQKAGLPCYLTQKTLECCTNKRNFKDLCVRLGIQTIPEVSIRDLATVEYPLLIKPVDNSGSKGITICYDESMVKSAYERALRFSKRKGVIVERFMNCDYVTAYYTVREGNVELSILMDKDMNRIGRGAVPYPTAFVYPSRYHAHFLKQQNLKIIKLAKLLDMRNGTFQIGFFVSGNNYYAVELTARLTATREYLFVKDMTGIDTLEMHINYALSGSFHCERQKMVMAEQPMYCMLFVFLKEGIIRRIEGIDKVITMRGVLNVLQLRKVGAKIRADGSYGQLFARIYLKADSKEKMIELVDTVQSMLQVYTDEEKPMVIAGFDAMRFLL